MEINNELSVDAPIERAWATLTDLAGIAPCLPGARLTGVEGDTYLGTVKVKVGPVTTEYRGTARFIEKDESTYRAKIDAKGTESRGAGNASAQISASLRPDGAATIVSVSTDLAITGKVAQFGRGMIQEISAKLLGQFVKNLEAKLREDAPAPAPAPSAAEAAPAVAAAAVRLDETGTPPKPAPAPAREDEALDLMKIAGGSVRKRLVPVVVVAAVLLAALIYALVA